MAEVETERKNPFEIFSPAVRENVVGLSFLGFLEKTIHFCGHEFVIKTLRPSEESAVATVIEPWRGTLAEPAAWNNGHVALALVSIDGDEAFCPAAGPEITSFARARLNYITNPETGWFQPTLDFLYYEYTVLKQDVQNAIDEFRSLAGRSPQPSQPSADSLTVPGTSADETPSDSPPLDPSS